MAENVDSSTVADSTESVTKGASLFLVAKLVVMGSGFLLTLILTRYLGGALYGVFALGQRVVQSALMFTNLGSDVSTTKYISANRGRPDFQRRMVGLATATTTVVSLLGAAVLFVAAPYINDATLQDPLLTPVLRLFALILPFRALTRVPSNVFRGLELPEYQNLVKIGRSVGQLAGVAVAVALGYSVVGVVGAVVLASGVVFVLASIAMVRRTSLVPARGASREEFKDFYNLSVPLTLSRTGSLLFNRMDIFMVGILLTSTDVGIYNVALLLASLIAVPLAGFNQLFPSVASRLYSKDQMAELEAVYATVTRWAITVSLIIAAPVVIYHGELLAMFGPEFTAGAGVLILFVFGQLVNAASGPSNDILTMTDNQYVVLVNHWVFGVLNVVLNYVMITEFGLVGAAMATATVLAVLNVTRVIEVWYFEGLFAYSRRLWKPLTAGCVGVGVMGAVALLFSGLPAAIAGGAAGAAVYALCLYALGIEQVDRDLAEQFLGKVVD